MRCDSETVFVTNMNANFRAHTKVRGDHGWAPLVVDSANKQTTKGIILPPCTLNLDPQAQAEPLARLPTA